MYSVSGKGNNYLTHKISSTEQSSIPNRVSLAYWKPHWYIKTKGCGVNVPVTDVKRVEKYYQSLDAEQKLLFLEENETKYPVPYQELREHLKMHENTKYLVEEVRRNFPSAPCYLTIMDSDIVDYNKVFSSYLAIVKDAMNGKTETLPDIMSTGYIFPNDAQFGKAMTEASQICREIRAITAQHLPLGTYYPEPNFCILIDPEENTVPESFISCFMLASNQESRVIIKHLKKSRGQLNAVFSSEKAPIITALPERCMFYKSEGEKDVKNRKAIHFSTEFMQGQRLSLHDLHEMRQISQHNLDPTVWFSNLVGNGALELKSNVELFNNLMHKMRKAKYQQNTSQVIQNLTKRVFGELPPEYKALWLACTAVGEYICGKFSTYNLRSRVCHVFERYKETEKKDTKGFGMPSNSGLDEFSQLNGVFNLLQLDCVAKCLRTLKSLSSDHLWNLSCVADSEVAKGLKHGLFSLDQVLDVVRQPKLLDKFKMSPMMESGKRIDKLTLGKPIDTEFIEDSNQTIIRAVQGAFAHSSAEEVVEHGLENYLEYIDFSYINSQLRGKESEYFKEIVENFLEEMGGGPQSFDDILECQEQIAVDGHHFGYCVDSDCDECQDWRDTVENYQERSNL